MARSVIALVACMVLLGSHVSVACAEGPPASSLDRGNTHATARFDIDRQPLASALRAFSEQSGTAVLFDDALVAERYSAAVHADATPRDALSGLLVGTGLHMKFSSASAFTVMADDAPSGAATPLAERQSEPTPVLADADAALIQGAVQSALCAHNDTRPGRFRLALQMWIGASGGIDSALALAPSDDAGRDDRVLAAVRSVRLPARLALFSPVTILLTPSPLSADPCRGIHAWQG